MKEVNYNITVRQQLRKLREIRGLNQIDVATIIGKKQTAYCQYENGDRKISIDNLCKIADEFDLPLDWFTGRDTNTDRKLKNQ